MRLGKLAVPGLDRRTARLMTEAVAVLRCALGVGAYLAPGLPAAPWVGREASRQPATRLFARTLAGRDLALGLGALQAMLSGSELRGWVVAGTLADTGDLVATLLDLSKLPRRSRWLVVATTAGAALAGLLCAALVDAPGDELAA